MSAGTCSSDVTFTESPDEKLAMLMQKLFFAVFCLTERHCNFPITTIVWTGRYSTQKEYLDALVVVSNKVGNILHTPGWM